jgi:hypothetical protein
MRHKSMRMLPHGCQRASQSRPPVPTVNLMFLFDISA